jgi:DNA-binding beta-propeller fold protein YncE
VADLKSGKVVHSIKGLEEPQGIRFITGSNAIFVANGVDGVCKVFNADSYRQIAAVELDGDADNVRYDASAKKIYVGYGSGGIATIDAATFRKLADIKLEGHPESFQLGDRRIFVNVPDARLLEVVDPGKNSIEARWKIEAAASNYPMALDTANHRLFVGCRQPAKLLVIDTETGKITATLDTDSDTDDIFYDRAAGRIYMSCGGGYVDVFRQMDPDRYKSVFRAETRSGARTSLFVPQLNQFIVAAPARSGNEAELMIFDGK